MVNKKIYLVVGIVLTLLLFSFLSYAEEFPDNACGSDEECQLEDPFGWGLGDLSSCLILEEGTEGYCVIDEVPADELPVNETDINATGNETIAETSSGDQEQLDALNLKLAQLESLALQLQTQVGELSSQDQNVGLLVETLNADIQEITFQQNQIQEDVDRKINSVSVGLASVQIDLNATQEKLDTVEETILARENFTRILTYVIFVLVALAAAVLVIYYVQRRSGSTKKIDAKSRSYITQMIRRGLKYPVIKQNLIKAGWPEDDINLAYKETLKENYSQYVRKSGSSGGILMADNIENRPSERR